MRLACHLRGYREQSGRTLRQVAADAGISPGTLSVIETGRMLPTEEQIPELERAYGMPVHKFWPDFVLAVVEREAGEDQAA